MQEPMSFPVHRSSRCAWAESSISRYFQRAQIKALIRYPHTTIPCGALMPSGAKSWWQKANGSISLLKWRFPSEPSWRADNPRGACWSEKVDSTTQSPEVDMEDSSTLWVNDLPSSCHSILARAACRVRDQAQHWHFPNTVWRLLLCISTKSCSSSNDLNVHKIWALWHSGSTCT